MSGQTQSDRLDKLRAMLEADPDNTLLHYGIAMELKKLGRAEEAVTHFDRTLAIDPHYHYAYYHKGATLEEAGDFDAARQTYAAGVERAREAGDEKALGELQGVLDLVP